MKSCTLTLMVTVIVSLFFSSCGGTGSSQTTYTVGGSVNGLLGTGFVLQNNGGNSLPVSANGNFTFTTRIASGNAYHVTVLTQPSNPAQTCRVINGSGTVSSNITGIGVSCAHNPASGLYLFEETYGSSLNLATIDSSTGALSSPVWAGPADVEGNVPGVAVDPLGQTLYALDASVTSISGFSISGPGLQLHPLAGSPFSSSFPNGGLNSLALHPTGKFLYIVRSPARIEVFSVDASSGGLMYSSAVTEMADFRSAVIDPSGNFLYVASFAQIYAYQINLTDGSLTAIAGSPFSSPASDQAFLTPVFDSTAKYLLAPLSVGGVEAFALESSTGALLQVPGSPFPTSAGTSPMSIAADPAGSFIYVCNYDGPLDGFEVDKNSGALTAVAGSPFSTPARPSSCIVDPSGQFVYVSINDIDSAIYGFRLNPSTGSLSPLGGSPFTSILNPTGLFAVKLQ
jgi:6-phosphogluconolactonase (cycloisomerase 2 family)